MKRVENKYGEKWYSLENDKDIWEKVDSCILEYPHPCKVRENNDIAKIETKMDRMGIMELCINLDEDYWQDNGLDKSEAHPYLIINVHGGLNGPGKWSNYLKEITVFFENLENRFGYSPWLIEMTNDCLDDVFDMVVGIRLPKEIYQKYLNEND